VDYVPTAQSKKKAILALAVVAVLYFVYTGIEQIIGAWLNTLLIEKRMFTATLGGACVSCYYGSIMAGRLVFGLFSSKIGNRLTIYIGLGLAVVGAGLFFITTSVSATFVAVIMIGLGFAPFYPCNMHEAKKRFSADMSKKAIGVQVCSACFGILALSPSVGLLIQHVGHETLPIVAMTLILVLVAFTVLINLLTKPKKQLIVEN
jgi:fucose permease